MIESRLVGSVTVLQIHGRLTLESGLRGAVHHAFDSGSRRIVLNLHDVTGIDSSGFAELITCETNALKHGGRLVVCSPSPRAYEVFVVTQLNSVFTVYDTEAQALASVQAT